MGFFGDSSNRFKDYLDKKQNDNQVRCTICYKSADDIRAEYYKYMLNPSKEFEDINIDDLLILSEKTSKPICAACYFAIMRNPDLINELFEKPEDEIW